MIGTLLKISWLNLRRDYIALGLTLVLPIVFFSIFAVIFGGMGERDRDSALDILVVDRDHTELSEQLVKTIGDLGAVIVSAPAPELSTREAVRDVIRTGEHSVAVIIPAGFGDTFARLRVRARPVEIIYDAADPVTHNIVTGLLDAAALRAAPDVLLENWLGELTRLGGAMTAEQHRALDVMRPYLRGDKPWQELVDQMPNSDSVPDRTGPAAGVAGLLRVEATPARGDDRGGSIIAYYAAGISVMFLLFSMTAAAGALLEEEESGTLERVLMSNATMTGLLVAKWVFYSILGVVQVTLMFVWAALVFDLNLFTARRLIGFSAITLVTGLAGSGFGIFLATACRTRAQLTGLSIILVLIMSALGGSMVPRFAMPDFMHTTSLFTFNGWALDGYLNVFWYDDPDASVGRGLLDLVPQLLVLAAMAGVFLAMARLMARRWEIEP
ncbi:MAG: ABC transporter permease [Proteobacteria bacterium]|nr:ABC transporter permease [Pseudomonadota bacterium]